MKTSTTRLMIAAAALVVAAGSASAQTYNARIPVAFSAGGAVMEPGSYLIQRVDSSSQAYTVFNLETHRSILVVTGPKTDTPKSWADAGGPKLDFVCWEDGCALNRFYDGEHDFTYKFSHRETTTMASSSLRNVTVAMLKVK